MTKRNYKLSRLNNGNWQVDWGRNVPKLKDAVGGDNKDVIEAKVKALSEASAGLAQKLYAEQTEDAGSGGGADESSGGVDDDNVVDAEFEEVESDDDEQKSA